ncbi:NAD(P)-binding domain-containing protein [Clostridium sp. cel8]|uniref:NAD(P)H-dependent glycerol-3-phosphate dehydrogenase n=1 Tax=Clostridium sp. cel8 TaxID=2663123 RepID=UPI0015F4C1C7|nr:2-dehydropantoate 2-reductase N-terminal domain-containing protein [Clostridium sp. cel8]MBA5851605.1 NAD(P)-binding domain-containing protein [Clostridium sp. cel8]
MATVTIIGAGAMGSALTVPLVNNGHKVNLWGTELDDEIIHNLRNGMPHQKHKCNLPKEVNTFYADELDKAMDNTDLVIMAITSDALQKIFKRVVPYLHEGMIVGSVSKGFAFNKNDKIVILPKVLEEVLPEKLKNKINFVVVGGPCKAIEVVLQSPTAVTYSSNDIKSADFMKNILITDTYRIETNTDVVGTEVCAAMKNAYAISLGIAEGFKKKNEYPHNNTKSALFTIAISEMISLVNAMGGETESVIGLPGAGDLEVTGEAGRNKIFGEVIGGGCVSSKAIEEMKKNDITVEGYAAIKFGYNLVKQLESENKLSLKDMVLLNALYEIVYNDKPAYHMIKDILQKIY